MEQCCPNHFLGFCLNDGTPIILVIEGDVQTGWINIETGVFTFGPPPAGTTMCSSPPNAPLTCATDSVTICPGADPIVVEAVDLDIRPLTCATDSVTICQPVVNATLSNVTASVTSVTILPANPNRKGAVLYNDSTSNCFIKFGATASSTSFTIRMTSQTFYELVIGYVGVIDGIWALANGAMRITEYT